MGVILFLSLLSFLLTKHTVVPLFNPSHGIAGDTLVTEEIGEFLWTISVYPQCRLRFGHTDAGLQNATRDIGVRIGSACGRKTYVCEASRVRSMDICSINRCIG
jgi:hypothetical protein